MRRVFGILIAGLAVVAIVATSSPLHANCLPVKIATSNGYAAGGGSGAGYVYIQFPGTVDNTTFTGHFWQTTNTAINEGTYNPVPIGVFSTGEGSDSWNFFWNLGDANTTTGCPAGCLTVYLEDDLSDRFILWTAFEGAKTAPADYDFTDRGPGTVVASHSPRPRATLSGRAGNIVTVNFDVPDITASVTHDGGTCPAPTLARRVFIRQSPTPPSRLVAGWTQLGTDAAGAGPVSPRSNGFDCTTISSDWWVAVGLVVDGQNPYFVSEPMQIECDPNLADPGRGFKLIDRQPSKKPVRDN